MFKKLKETILSFFKIPESIIVFLSGILVSASINIFTCTIPRSAFFLPKHLVVSALLMLFSSCCLMYWAIIVKPCQEKHNKDAPNEKDWIQRIKENNTDTKLLVCSILSLLAFVISIILLFF